MGKPAARIGDMTFHGGSIVAGCPTVLIGGMPAARLGDPHVCPMLNPGSPGPPHVGGPISIGSPTVFIGGMMAARLGDMAVCQGPPDSIATGCPTVLIGEVAGGGPPGGGLGAAAAAGGSSYGAAATAASDAGTSDAGASDARTSAAIAQPNPTAGDQDGDEDQAHWLDVRFLDRSGLPIAGVGYDLTGLSARDERGRLSGPIRRSGIEEGSCQIQLRAILDARWSVEEAEVGESVTLQVDVTGFEPGAEAVLRVFKSDLSSADKLQDIIEATVQGDQVEGEWRFCYRGGEGNPELGDEPTGRTGRYASPLFYFTVDLEGQEARSGMLKITDRLRIVLKDEHGDPIEGEEYVVRLANGEVRRGTLDDNGQAIEANIPPERSRVTFPGTAGAKELPGSGNVCHQEIQATTADVLIAFQKTPGVHADNVIDGADAELIGSDRPVRPQGDGYYGLRMDAGSTSRLTFLGTTYVVRHIQGDVDEPDHGDDICISSWDTLGPDDRNSGVGSGMQTGIQRRLQLLGYYTGKVDGVMGRMSEEAILQFQADNRLRTDGQAGPITRGQLDTVTDDHTVTGGTHVIRRALVRFERAPSDTNASAGWGRPWGRAPDPDCRGSAVVPAVGFDLKGPVVSMARQTPFRVRLVRECIANDVTLIATSEDEDLVSVESTNPLPNDKQIILNLQTGRLHDRSPQHTSIRIHILRGQARTEIASLQVVVLPLIYRRIRPYWVTINGADHSVDSTLFSGAMPPVGTQALFNQAVAVANEILWPIGVRFELLGWREKTVILPNAGQITWGSANLDYRTIMQTNDSEGNATEEDKLNMHVVRRIEGALGISYSTRAYPDWPLAGIALRGGGDAAFVTAVEIGTVIAHELGHSMGLANEFVDPPSVHTEDDPSVDNQKNDIWSLRRLMFGGWPQDVRAADAWARNNGYGHDNRGSMISIRNLPTDRTDNECYYARRHAASNTFYRNP